MQTSNLALNIRQFQAEALSSLFSANPSGETDGFGDIFEQMLGHAKSQAQAVSAAASGRESVLPFSQPGQHVVTVLNRLELAFKAQVAELGELKNTLTQEQALAERLAAIDAHTSGADIKSRLRDFFTAYNAGVNRFTPAVAPGGVLEGSQEAARARFATRRDIADPLIGAMAGLEGGMSALGITVDPRTGLVSIDEAKLDAVLAQNTDADVHTIVDFARKFAETAATLNSKGNQQDRQMANLERAIGWIAENRAAVEKEFGPGQAARPNAAFAKAAAAYALMSRQ